MSSVSFSLPTYVNGTNQQKAAAGSTGYGTKYTKFMNTNERERARAFAHSQRWLGLPVISYTNNIARALEKQFRAYRMSSGKNWIDILIRCRSSSSTPPLPSSDVSRVCLLAILLLCLALMSLLTFASWLYFFCVILIYQKQAKRLTQSNVCSLSCISFSWTIPWVAAKIFRDKLTFATSAME